MFINNNYYKLKLKIIKKDLIFIPFIKAIGKIPELKQEDEKIEFFFFFFQNIHCVFENYFQNFFIFFEIINF